MKTAIQDLFDELEQKQQINKKISIETIKEYIRCYSIPTEKQQLLFFYDSGVSASVSAEQFYEQTFKNK